MDASTLLRRLPWHYWPAILVLLAGLVVTAVIGTGYRDRLQSIGEDLATSRHLTLATLLEERIQNLLDSGHQLAATATSSEPGFRQQANALLAYRKGILGIALVETDPDWPGELARARDNGQVIATPAVVFRPPPQPPAEQPAPDAVTPEATGTAGTSPAGTDPEQGQRMSMLFFPMADNRLVRMTLVPELWLEATFADHPLPAGAALQVHDLSQHSKRPLFRSSGAPDISHERTLRSELAFASRQWLLATISPPPDAGPAHTRLWLAGGGLSLLAAFLSFWLCRRQQGLQQALQGRDVSLGLSAQQLDNAQVEKTILRQALNDSEQRSRDLVELAGGVVAELDEQGRIGFVSTQVTELLDRPAAALAGQPWASLVSQPEQRHFLALLDAARQDRQVERMDLNLLAADGTAVAATLRVKVLSNPVDGVTGYRLCALRRPL